MKYLLIAILLLLLVGPIFSQASVSLDDVNNHIGDSVTVCGKVYSTRYLVSAKGSPTFLNMGASYPNQKLTLVLWGEDRKQFNAPPEELFNGQQICVTGKLVMYSKKPEIIITSKSQIKINTQND